MCIMCTSLQHACCQQEHAVISHPCKKIKSSLWYLALPDAWGCMQAKAKILVVRDIERDDIEFISKTLNCLPIAHVDHMSPDKLGHADQVAEQQACPHCLHAFEHVTMPCILA